MLVSEAKKGVFVLEVEKDIRREGGRGGEKVIYAGVNLMIWIYSYGSLQGDLCGNSADSPDTR